VPLYLDGLHNPRNPPRPVNLIDSLPERHEKELVCDFMRVSRKVDTRHMIVMVELLSSVLLYVVSLGFALPWLNGALSATLVP
jgi:hypothetical protein